jgi:hypothetical protein
MKIKNREQYGTVTRFILFFTGLFITCYMFVYSFEYSTFPYTLTILGYTITGIAVIAIITVLGFAGGWMMQIAVLGKRR